MRSRDRSESREFTRFRPRYGRRLLRCLLLLAVVAAVAAWFAPQLVTTELGRRWLVARILPGSPAKVEFESAIVSWLSPLEITELTISDETEAMISIERVTTSRSLLEMVMRPSELGTVRLEAPMVHVVVDQEGRNNIARLCGDHDWHRDQDDSGPTRSRAIKLEATDGRLLVTDMTQGREFTADNTSVLVTLPADGAEPIHVQLSTLALDAGQQGSLDVEMKWWPARDAHRAGEGSARLQADRFPITLATALAGAAGVELQGTGSINANLECEWSENQQGLTLPVKGTLTGRDVAVRIAPLRGDTLRSEKLDVELDVLVDAGKISVQQLHAESDLGSVQATGAAPLSTFSTGDDLATIADHQLRLEGTVNLPELTRQLRQTLRMRDGAQITDGQARLTIISSGNSQRHAVEGRCSTERLVGQVNGKPIEWNEAASLDFAAVSARGQLALERAVCQTPFAQLELKGDWNGGELVGQSDLSALVAQLGQFVDFGGWHLEGIATAKGQWRRDGQLLTVNLDTEYRDLVIRHGTTPWLAERQLTARSDLRLVTEGGQVDRVESASTQMIAGPDQLLVRLKQPVDIPAADVVWPIYGRATGELGSWLVRLDPRSGWRVAGSLDLQAEGWMAGPQFEIPQLTVQLLNVAAASGMTRIDEPNVSMQASLRGNTQTLDIHVQQLSGTSSTVAINSRDIDLRFPQGRPKLSGVLAIRGDLGRAKAWLAPGNTQTWQGSFEGQMELEPVGETVQIDATVACRDVLISAPPTVGRPLIFVEGAQVGTETPVWSEQQVQVAARGTWRPLQDALQLDQLQVTSDEASVTLQGTVTEVTGSALADLSGRIRYDLQTISRKLNTSRPTGVSLVGAHDGPLVIRGPLLAQASLGAPHNALPTAPATSSLFVGTTLAWEAASFYGINLERHQLNLELRDGRITTSPIEATVAGGRLRATPMIDLVRQPLAVVLAGETTLDGAQLTPEFCDQWIKYVAPLLAGTTTASGDFSVVLSQASIPLMNPQMADLSGRMLIGSARLQPGPVAQNLYTVSQDITTLFAKGQSPFSFMAPDRRWLEISNQQVDFQMTQGRIYHQNLSIAVGDVPVISRGWVGLDQSVALVAEIQVQDKWLGSSRLLAGLKGQTIQVPIHGSLTRPQLDQRALAQLSTQLMGSTAGRLLDEQLQKGLQELFGPK